MALLKNFILIPKNLSFRLRCFLAPGILLLYLKAQADALFTELGMNLTTAFNIFVRQSLREGGIPFEVRLEQPNKETVAAMLEAERIAKDPSVKGYNDLDELFADLKR